MANLFSKLLGGRNPGPSPERAAAPQSSHPAPVEPEPSGLLAFFADDHRRCDDLWAAVEAQGAEGFAAFDEAMRHHFAMEEDVLFPAFEDATGMHGMGPPAIMRMEHEQMRRTLDAMAEAADLNELLDMGDTLLMLIQQHNIKEEGMLYPMAQEVLGGAWEDLRGTLP